MSIKKISESWFYNLNDLWEFSKLEIEKDIKVVLFDEWNFNKEIIVWENSKVKLCWFLQDENDYKMFMRQTWEGSKVKIKYLLLSKNNKKTKATIHSKIESNFSKTDVFVSSLSAENWEIDLDWIIELAPNFRQMAGHLIEENVFLWEKAKIRWIPTLLVKSNEVVEINSYEQLRDLDCNSIELQNESISLICKEFDCKNEDITEIKPLKREWRTALIFLL